MTMENIESRDGEVTLAISGTYTPQELRELFRRLSQAHAAATGEAFNGEPLYSVGGSPLLQVGHGDSIVGIGVHLPFFGWTQAAIDIPRAQKLVAELQAAIASAAGSRGPRH